MPRALASLLLSLASWALLALIIHGTFGLYCAIAALMLGFAGAFSGFVAGDPTAGLGHNRLARAGAIIGCAALLIGSGLFLRAIMQSP